MRYCRSPRWMLVLFLTACLVSGGCARRGGTQQCERVLLPNVAEIEYLVYFPPQYDSTTERWPLVLFLHGAGQRGTDIDEVKNRGLPRRIADGDHFPFLVVSPQCRTGRWDAEVLQELLDYLVDEYEVDDDRIYATGLSMGGFGTWRLAAHCPERLAAIAPLCGGGDVQHAHRLTDLPIWAFHGTGDDVVPVGATREMVSAVESLGGEVQFTEYPDAKHDCWTETYNNPELYTWLLRHRRQ